LFLGFVCEHRPTNYITDGINVINRGFQMIVYNYTAPLIQLNTGVFKSEPFRIRFSPYRNQAVIAFKLYGFTFFIFSTYTYIFAFYTGTGYFMFEVEFEAQLFQNLLKLFSQRPTPGWDQGVGVLHDAYLCA